MRQADFIGRIRNALGVAPFADRCCPDLFAARDPGEAEARLRQVDTRSDTDRQTLIARLEQMAAPIKLHVRQVDDLPAAAADIAELIEKATPEWGARKQVAAWRHPLIEGLNLDAVLKPQAVPVVYAPLSDDVGRDVDAVQRDHFRAAVAASYVGVTSADYCVADSATLVMKTRPGQARSVSLVPSIHVAVIQAHRIIADLGELFALLTRDPDQSAEGLTNCLTFISGPSKTADIEAHMVHGAHGPRELHLLILKG